MTGILVRATKGRIFVDLLLFLVSLGYTWLIFGKNEAIFTFASFVDKDQIFEFAYIIHFQGGSANGHAAFN